ncbi:hypothetical protein BDW22DRAFT_845777 [Trametopsis cervina]|nr:hypothetical protein BDW22DRAFT_845777 [Trametopsis cervina]
MNPEPSFIPGYVHVEQFGPDELYEDDGSEVVEEVEYITLDLGSVEPTLVPSTSSFRLVGLDTPTPFLQLSGTVFKGEHHALLGTELLFVDSKDGQNERKQNGLTHLANTERRIQFKEVELKPQHSPEEAPPAEPSPQATTTPARRRRAETVQQMIGGENVQSSSQGSRKRQPKQDKGKGREVVQSDVAGEEPTVE